MRFLKSGMVDLLSKHQYLVSMPAMGTHNLQDLLAALFHRNSQRCKINALRLQTLEGHFRFFCRNHAKDQLAL